MKDEKTTTPLHEQDRTSEPKQAAKKAAGQRNTRDFEKKEKRITTSHKAKTISTSRRFEENSTYYTISVYTIITVLICAILVRLVFMAEATLDIVEKVVRWGSPYLVAIFIAFLLYPMVRKISNFLADPDMPLFLQKNSNGIAIFLTYVVSISVITMAIWIVIPQAYQSVQELVVSVPIWYRRLIFEITDINTHFPELDMSFVVDKLRLWGENFVNTIKLQEQLENVVSVAMTVLTTSYSVLSLLINSFIAFAMSIYLLTDRKRIANAVVNVLGAYTSEKNVRKTCQIASECYEIFARFVSGKLLDSLIIGLICMTVMSMFKIPYAEAISIVVGITNMIPYFGPFIGAVPGAMILIMVSPIKCLIYLGIILALQQFDGLVLGPKILGDSTGLRPAWIIVAVAVGGKILGVIGMFIGVPVFAVIGHLASIMIEHHRTVREEIEYQRLTEELKKSEMAEAVGKTEMDTPAENVGKTEMDASAEAVGKTEMDAPAENVGKAEASEPGGKAEAAEKVETETAL